MKAKLEVYGLSVCFAAMVCLVVAGAYAAYALVMITAPSSTLERWQFLTYATNDDYWRYKQQYMTPEDKARPKPNAEELSVQRKEAFDIAIAAERHSGFQRLLQSLMFIVGGAVAFLSHWRIATRARSDAHA